MFLLSIPPVNIDYISYISTVFLQTRPSGFIEKQRFSNYLGLVKSRAIILDCTINRATFAKVDHSIVRAQLVSREFKAPLSGFSNSIFVFCMLDIAFCTEVFNEMINHYILGIVNEDGREYYLNLQNNLTTCS